MSKCNYEDDFWAQVDKNDTSGCWVWIGRIAGQYGQANMGKITRQRWVHRISYELSGKDLTKGLVLHHKCKNKLCVKPDHLEEMTQRECNRKGRQTKVSFKMADGIKEDLKNIHLEPNDEMRWKVFRSLGEKWGVSATGIYAIYKNVAPSCIPLNSL